MTDLAAEFQTLTAELAALQARLDALYPLDGPWSDDAEAVTILRRVAEYSPWEPLDPALSDRARALLTKVTT